MATEFNIPSTIKGDTFEGVTFTLVRGGSPIDMTGASLRMMLKQTATQVTPELTLSTPSSGLTITDATNGIFKIDKQIISIDAFAYFYDIELTEVSGDINTYIDGKWIIKQDITT